MVAATVFRIATPINRLYIHGFKYNNKMVISQKADSDFVKSSASYCPIYCFYLPGLDGVGDDGGFKSGYCMINSMCVNGLVHDHE